MRIALAAGILLFSRASAFVPQIYRPGRTGGSHLRLLFDRTVLREPVASAVSSPQSVARGYSHTAKSVPKTRAVNSRRGTRGYSTPTFSMSAGEGDKTRVLFVCLGNICRSPTAEAVFRQVTDRAGAADDFVIDSCGTGGGSPNWYMQGGNSYHEGDPPDSRMTSAALNRGVKLGGGSRPLKPDDLDNFDLIVGMDAENSKAISTAAEHWGKKDLADTKMRTMTSYCRSSGDVKKVPDPYYGGPQGFELVLDLLDDACEGLLQKCREGNA